MKLIFFQKCPYFYADFKNAMKLPENEFGFEDNFV